MATTITPPTTLVQAIRYFQDPDICLAFLTDLRWPDGVVVCPRCGSTKVGFLSTRRLWECKMKHPRRQFSIKVGTIFEDSPIPLDKWLAAVWLIANAKNGISSYELHRDLKITQKSAWFVLHRIRLAMQAGTFNKLGGGGKTVEVDESWIGGRARSMNKKQLAKTKTGHSMGPYAYTGKAIVLDMLERGGRVRTRVVPDVKKRTLVPAVKDHVEFGTEVHTDAHSAYASLENPITAMSPEAGSIPEERLGEPMYDHKSVDHAAQESVRGNVHTNGIENFWSLLKRGSRASLSPPPSDDRGAGGAGGHGRWRGRRRRRDGGRVVTMPKGPAKRAPLKWPGAERDDRTPFERFRDLAGRLVRVPKADIDQQAAKYRRGRRKPPK